MASDSEKMHETFYDIFVISGACLYGKQQSGHPCVFHKNQMYLEQHDGE